MDPVTAAAIVGGVSAIGGGILGKKAADRANRANADMAAQNIALQREFAQNGLRWKVEDAKAAGIHPLYALGASGASFSPVSIGATPDTSLPSALNDMGQNVSRAISATKTQQEKELAALHLATAKTQLQGVELDNQLKAKQLNAIGTTAPAFPSGDSGNFIPGQGNSPVLVRPSERSANAPGRPAQQAGHVTDIAYARTDTGYTPVPSKDVKERIEDQFVPEFMWAMRNQLAPNLGLAEPPSKSQLPKGAYAWKWSTLRQEWQPVYKGQKVPYGGRNEETFKWKEPPTVQGTIIRR